MVGRGVTGGRKPGRIGSGRATKDGRREVGSRIPKVVEGGGDSRKIVGTLSKILQWTQSGRSHYGKAQEPQE